MPPAPLLVPKLTSLRDVPHALPYQGSKRGLAHAIVRLIPPEVTTLIEPFAGSAAVSLAARHRGLVEAIALNDVNAPLMELWREIVRRPARVADTYEKLWHAQLPDPRGYYQSVRDEFNGTGDPHLLLYLLARCVKAAVRYSRGGLFNQSADHRRLGVSPPAMRERVIRASRVLSGCQLGCGDYRGPLLAAPADAFVYLDPPYQGVSNVRDHRYLSGLRRTEFEQALRLAVRAGTSFVVSYDVVTDNDRYGAELSPDLGLLHLHVEAGRSSQATLHGVARTTIESLYLSPALVDRLGGPQSVHHRLVADEPQLPVTSQVSGDCAAPAAGNQRTAARSVSSGSR